MIFSFYIFNLWWHQNLGRHIPDFIPALWKVRKCIKYGKVKENSVKYPNVENCISVLLWFIIRLSVLKKFYIRNSYLQITGLHIPVYEFFTVLFPIFLLRFVLWRKFFFDTVSLVTWCGRGNVGYYSETDRVVEHREMGLRQVEIAFSLILANFLNDFFKEEHNKMLENFWIGLQIACQKGGQKEAKKYVYTKNMSLGSYRNNH